VQQNLVIFHGLFGGWGWERFDQHGEVVAESRQAFETREECAEDARAHAAVAERSATHYEYSAATAAAE